MRGSKAFTTFLLIAATFGVVASEAAAEPDWVPLAPILDSPPATGQQQIGFQSNGRETVAQIELASISPTVSSTSSIGSRLPGDALTSESTIASTLDRAPISSEIAVAPSGAAVICITDLLGGNPANLVIGFRAMYRAAGSSTWSAPVVVVDSPVASTSNVCRPVIAANGTAAVVATRTTVDAEPRRNQVVARVLPVGGSWTAAEVLSDPNRSLNVVDAAMDGSGNLMVIWNERWSGNDTATTADDYNTVKVKSRLASTGFFGLTGDIAGAEGQPLKNTFAPTMAMGASGRTVIGWQQGAQAWATIRETGTASFETPQQITTGGASSSTGSVGVAPNGTIYATAWNQTSPVRVEMFRRPVGELWSAPKLIGPANLNRGDGSFAFAGNDAFFGSSAGILPSGPGVSYAVRWQNSQAEPDAFREIFSPSSGASLTALGSDLQGGVFGMADSITIDGRQTKTVAFDSSPPVEKSVTVPAGATAGETVNMSASFADRWSTMGAISWNFGDGGSATGESVSYGWPAAGSYDVTITATDSRGNARQAVRTIQVDPVVVPDTVKPTVTLKKPPCGKKKGKACKAFLKKRAAWRNLRGNASDNVGLARVEVAVARKSGRKFDVLKSGKFRKGQSAKAAASAFNRAKLKANAWSFRIPKSWKPGAYTFRVKATDTAGNVSKVVVRKVKLG
ncbi:MAG: PKD domain-containing protein [Solirubrobacterales bacterium]|nr:PKD domain-containing protein [Solirubrobacterales bacterium]